MLLEAKTPVDSQSGEHLAESIEVEALVGVAGDALEEVVGDDGVFAVEDQATMLKELVKVVAVHSLFDLLALFDELREGDEVFLQPEELFLAELFCHVIDCLLEARLGFLPLLPISAEEIVEVDLVVALSSDGLRDIDGVA